MQMQKHVTDNSPQKQKYIFFCRITKKWYIFHV